MPKIVLKSTFSLLNADYVKLNKSWNYRNVISPFFRLYLIDGGKGLLFNTESSVTLEEGFLYLVPGFTLCNYTCDEFLSQYYMQFIEESADGSSLFSSNRKILKIPYNSMDLENFRRLLQLNPGRGLWRHNPKDYEKRPILQKYREMNDYLDLSSYVETTGIILQFVGRFVATGSFAEKEPQKIPSKVLESIHYIQTNLSSNLSVVNIAETIGLNPDYFSRIFLEYTGERPLTYIQFKRIEHAQFMMLTTGLSLQDIAMASGFESLSYFARIFKKVTGQKPGQYRINNRTF